VAAGSMANARQVALCAFAPASKKPLDRSGFLIGWGLVFFLLAGLVNQFLLSALRKIV
jgi:hypothetical protein